MGEAERDRRFMAAALAVGRQGLGRTAPNPSVGCVIVADGHAGPVIAGLARTADGGRPHAERVALRHAGDLAKGATVYVTLEPCSHTGRTPPCVEALIHARVRRVVVGTGDPNPLVAGAGLDKLRAVGIEVVTGVRAAEAEWDLAGHMTRMRQGRPHVTLKLAVSLEGAIGRVGEGQLPISGGLSRTKAHLMRAQADAIAVGIGTILADNPRLTCRLPGLVGRSPHRVVFDRQARTPLTARVFEDVPTFPLTIFHGADAPVDRLAALAAAGAELFEAETLAGALRELAAEGIMSVLLEGGGELADAFLAADLIDRIAHIQTQTVLEPPHVAPEAARGAIALAPRFRHVATERVADDRWIWMER